MAPAARAGDNGAMGDALQTILLGIVEGLTEFLPVSSTGHLLIAEHWLGARSELFNVAIQAGAILAVVLIYWRRLLELLRCARAEARVYLAKLALAFGVTVAGGFIAKHLGLTLPETVKPVALALVLGGLVILLIEWYVRDRPPAAAVSWNAAFWIGAAQVLAAVFPGTSRSAATIFAAMLAGVTSRPAATEFAFLVGIPTMFAATGYELLKQRGTDAALVDWNALLLGFAVSAIVAFAAVKWLLRYVQTHRFTVFAWYRIAAGLALLLLVR
jgi:undecaprenyl-diphosphatase